MSRLFRRLFLMRPERTRLPGGVGGAKPHGSLSRLPALTEGKNGSTGFDGLFDGCVDDLAQFGELRLTGAACCDDR